MRWTRKPLLDRLIEPRTRIEMMCSVFETAVPAGLNLEWLFDVAERDRARGAGR